MEGQRGGNLKAGGNGSGQQKSAAERTWTMGKRRNDGRKRVSFSYEGKRYYCYGKTIQEARENEFELKKKLIEGVYKKGRDLTLDEYHERWEAARHGTVKGATIRKQSFEYADASKAVIDKAGTVFGKLKLVDIERQNVKDLQAALSKKYSTTSVNGIVALIGHILNDAVNDRILTWNPAKGVKPLKRTEPEARDTNHRALTVEETKAFFKAAEGSWYYNLYRFLINSGCRCGEAGALKASDIRGDVVKIERTITKSANGVYHIGETAKTRKGQRDIPYTEGIRAAVEAQKAQNAVLFGSGPIKLDSCIFQSPRGTLLSVTVVNRDIRSICQKAGIEHFTAHAFRDTFATRAIESGMKPKTLQEILGHANIGVTMNLYAHVMEETKRTEMQSVVIAIG